MALRNERPKRVNLDRYDATRVSIDGYNRSRAPGFSTVEIPRLSCILREALDFVAFLFFLASFGRAHTHIRQYFAPW